MPTEKNTSLPGLKEKRYQQKKNIIGDLYRAGELSKPEICRLTNMTTPTISKIIEELIKEGWVIDKGPGLSIGGKRPHIFSLNPDSAYIMGVDMGRELLKIAIFNLHRRIIGEIQIFPSLLEKTKDNNVLINDLQLKIEKSLIDLKIPRAKIKVAGFSFPGLLDNDGNSFTYLNFKDTNIRAVLENMLNIPIFLDNDSSIMAMAEHSFGIAKDAQHALCVNVNECIGLGMILNSRPYNGYKGMAGEFGHIRITDQEQLCYCGKTGCLETIASGRAIIKAAQTAIEKGKITALSSKELLTFTDIIKAANKDDIFAIELLQKAGSKIGEALASLIHLFNPELIVIGGEITAAHNIIIPAIQQAIDKYTITRLKNHCVIKISPLSDHACILGTLSLVMEHLHYDSNSSFSLY